MYSERDGSMRVFWRVIFVGWMLCHDQEEEQMCEIMLLDCDCTAI